MPSNWRTMRKVVFSPNGEQTKTKIQRIAITEKYRPIYERQAKENQVLGGGDKKTGLVNLPKAITPTNTSEKLAEIAGVSEKTYRMGAKVLGSDNEEVKQRVLSIERNLTDSMKELK